MEFSVIIPTFNNLQYLKLCIKSLLKNSKFKHELIFHINDGSDGTYDYIKDQNYKFTHSENNVGLCKAMNSAVKISTKKYIIYAHDDMYFCPGWDVAFKEEIQKHHADKDFFLSGTMIQPFKSFIYLDCGKKIEEFNESKLLKEYDKIKYADFQGSSWAPSLIPINTWNKVGGFSEEYGPGLGSDPDFNMKLWNIGVRLFKGLANSRVYHFSSISLRNKIWNDGHKIFLLKWRISIKFFRKYYMRADTLFDGELTAPAKNFMYYFDFIKCQLKYYYLKIIRT